MSISEFLSDLRATSGWHLVDGMLRTTFEDMLVCPIRRLLNHRSLKQLSPADQHAIVLAADNHPDADPILRKNLFFVCGVPLG